MPWRPILIASPPVTVARPSTVGAGGSIPATTQAARVACSATLRHTAVPPCGRYRPAPLPSCRALTQSTPTMTVPEEAGTPGTQALDPGPAALSTPPVTPPPRATTPDV